MSTLTIRTLRRIALSGLTILWLSGQSFLLFSQAFPNSPTNSYTLATEQTGRLTCPGGFPTNLTVTNCDYTNGMRLQQWVTTSFSDQAMLGAIVYGAGAQIIKSPGEWGRTWGGYGDRVGVRYTQGAARGTAELIVGGFLHDDPRHLSYKDDPHTHYGEKILDCGPGRLIKTFTYGTPSHLVWRRIGHAFADSVTVLKSNPCGIGNRIPAFDRFVGVSASAYGGYAWYPRAENTLPNAGLRAGSAYGSTLVGSFYTEFSPEISIVISRLFTPQKKQP